MNTFENFELLRTSFIKAKSKIVNKGRNFIASLCLRLKLVPEKLYYVTVQKCTARNPIPPFTYIF